MEDKEPLSMGEFAQRSTQICKELGHLLDQMQERNDSIGIEKVILARLLAYYITDKDLLQKALDEDV